MYMTASPGACDTLMNVVSLHCTMGQAVEIDILEVCKRKIITCSFFIEKFSLFL